MAKKSGKKKSGTKKAAAKKKAAKKSATKKAGRKKGGFGVFVRQFTDVALGDPEDTVAPDRLVLHEIASDLKDTGSALRWIKENAEEHEGSTLVIAQIKQTVSLTVKKVTKVTLSQE